MTTLTEFKDVKKMLVELITQHHSTIAMIREHTGIPRNRIYELVTRDVPVTRKEKFEINALFRDVLHFEKNPKALMEYLTSQQVIDKKKEIENAESDIHDFYDSGPDFKELNNYANKHGV